MPNVLIYNYEGFVHKCKQLGVDDNSVGCFPSYAFISIMDPGTIMEYRYFKHSHENVLNMDFSDFINEFQQDINGLGKPITAKQADILVEFIERNLGSDILLSCTGTGARSKAIYEFIIDNYPKYYSDRAIPMSTNLIKPNELVFRNLINAFIRRHLP